MISTNNDVSAATASASAAQQNSAQSELTASFDMFLGLLTTQLENQDPLSPMDSTEFTNQLVQYSSVEQAIKTNDQLADLIDMMRATETTAALDYLGREVEVQSDRVQLGSEGGANFAYDLERDAKAVGIQILDARGQTVQVLEAPNGAGQHAVEWDGLDLNGNRAAAGTYQILVSAIDPNGNNVPASTRVRGVVDAVERTANGYLLEVNGRLVAADGVEAIRHQPVDVAAE